MHQLRESNSVRARFWRPAAYHMLAGVEQDERVELSNLFVRSEVHFHFANPVWGYQDGIEPSSSASQADTSP